MTKVKPTSCKNESEMLDSDIFQLIINKLFEDIKEAGLIYDTKQIEIILDKIINYSGVIKEEEKNIIDNFLYDIENDPNLKSLVINILNDFSRKKGTFQKRFSFVREYYKKKFEIYDDIMERKNIKRVTEEIRIRMENIISGLHVKEVKTTEEVKNSIIKEKVDKIFGDGNLYEIQDIIKVGNRSLFIDIRNFVRNNKTLVKDLVENKKDLYLKMTAELIFTTLLDDKRDDFVMRIILEEYTYEKMRIRAEKIQAEEKQKAEAEEKRKQNDEIKKAEEERAKQEEERKKAEEERVKQEEERKKNENKKAKQEQERVRQEEERKKAEDERVKQEDERKKKEEEKSKKEQERAKQEEERKKTEEERVKQEEEREKNENKKDKQEQERVKQEQERIKQEEERKKNEEERTKQEQERVKQEDERKKAEEELKKKKNSKKKEQQDTKDKTDNTKEGPKIKEEDIIESRKLIIEVFKRFIEIDKFKYYKTYNKKIDRLNIKFDFLDYMIEIVNILDSLHSFDKDWIKTTKEEYKDFKQINMNNISIDVIQIEQYYKEITKLISKIVKKMRSTIFKNEYGLDGKDVIYKTFSGIYSDIIK